VKTVLVAGFFDPVQRTLKETFPEQLAAGSLVWIGQRGIGRELNLGDFKSRFYDRLAAGTTQVLVLLAVLRGREWVQGAIESILDHGKERNPGLQTELVVERNAQELALLLEKISEFGLPDSQEVTTELLRDRLGGTRVLCVCREGCTGFQESFERAGFPIDGFDSFSFVSIPSGKNSNLIEQIKDKSAQHAHLLYAWGGLRTLPPVVKQRYAGAKCEAETTGRVVALFKSWVLGRGR
jgi:hypothetical protein